ncbi:acylneuraminate cytidylyltransferase family protein, partial [candidate division KSB1 bacterium]|nr:acylneuraminate cytidylyltransferase family protein [candidate division KSB1 bacterium]
MSSNKKIIAVIPARGGSKGIEKKNIRSFAGKPLIAHTIEQAMASRSVQRIFVSTDDDEIASISKKCGAEIVWRPSGISSDTASSESALLHAVNELEEREQFSPDLVIFLQCTSPLRKSGDIDAAVQKFVEEKADSLLSVSKSHQFFWEERGGAARPVNYDYKKRPRRQDFGQQYVENGSIYICKSRILKEHKNRLGDKIAMYEMEKWQAFEIDDAEDFKLCEWLFQQHFKKKEP